MPSINCEEAISDRRDPNHKHVVDPVIIGVPGLQCDACLKTVPGAAWLRRTLGVGEDVDVVTGAELIVGIHRKLAFGIDQAPFGSDGKQFSYTKDVGD